MITTIISVNGQNHTLTDSYNDGDINTIYFSDYVYQFSGTQDALDKTDEIVMSLDDAAMLYTDNDVCLVFSNYEIGESAMTIICDGLGAEWVDFAERVSGSCGVYGS